MAERGEKLNNVFVGASTRKVTEPLALTLIRRDGTPGVYEVRLSSLKVAGRRILQSTVGDISERQQAEEKKGEC